MAQVNIDSWYTDLITARPSAIKGSLHVEGVRNKHLGGRMECAKAIVDIEPHERFIALAGSENESEYYFKAVVYGLLDVFLFVHSPLRDVRVTVSAVEIDPPGSSFLAFRNAGRIAGYKILDLAGLAVMSRVTG